MTNIPAIDINKPNSNYNAVKIQINDPQTNIPEGFKLEEGDSGIYNAVNIEVNRPAVNVRSKSIYNYPQSADIVTADYANIYPVELKDVPVLPLAYQTNLINSRTFVNAEIELEKSEPQNIEKEEKVALSVPEPNITTVEKKKALSFKALDNVEISPAVEIKPDVDINNVVSNLKNQNYDLQAQQMEEIAKIAMESPEKAVPYITTEIYNELIKIAKVDSTKLEAPSNDKIEVRKQIIINELVKEEAIKNGQSIENIELPYNLTQDKIKEAAKLSPMEQAERNKEYSLYTMAILTKLYINDVKEMTGNVVPLTDLPGVSTIVDTLRYNQNPSIKIASIDALRYIKRDEYKEELESIFKIASSDENPIVAKVAAAALESI